MSVRHTSHLSCSNAAKSIQTSPKRKTPEHAPGRESSDRIRRLPRSLDERATRGAPCTQVHVACPAGIALSSSHRHLVLNSIASVHPEPKAGPDVGGKIAHYGWLSSKIDTATRSQERLPNQPLASRHVLNRPARSHGDALACDAQLPQEASPGSSSIASACGSCPSFDPAAILHRRANRSLAAPHVGFHGCESSVASARSCARRAAVRQRCCDGPWSN